MGSHLCEGLNGSENCLDSLQIRFRNPNEYHSCSHSWCTVCPRRNPPTTCSHRSRYLSTASFLEALGRYFNVISAQAEIGNSCPKGGSVLGTKLSRTVALESGVLPLLSDLWMVVVD